ncbi:hypothetical protein [Methylobacter sp.]
MRRSTVVLSPVDVAAIFRDDLPLALGHHIYFNNTHRQCTE